MMPNQTIEVQLVDLPGNPLAIENVELDIVFFLHGKERYRFTSGVTNHKGHLTITFNHLNDQRKENQQFAIMDYNTSLEECDSEVFVRAPSIEELQLRAKNLMNWLPDKASEILDRINSLNNQHSDCIEVRCSLMNNHTTKITLNLAKTKHRLD